MNLTAEEFVLAALQSLPTHRIVGRKRLQKFGSLLKDFGLPTTFSFAIRDFGPFSGELASAAEFLSLVGPVEEIQESTGPCDSFQSTYHFREAVGDIEPLPQPFLGLIRQLDQFKTVELEVASTILHFLRLGQSREEAVAQTKAMKPTKAIPPVLSKADQILALGTLRIG